MKLLRDPIFIASMALVPAAVIGFAPLIEYKAFVLPTLAVLMWGCMLLQVWLPKGEGDAQPTMRAPSQKKIDKLAEQKFLLLKAKMDKDFALEREALNSGNQREHERMHRASTRHQYLHEDAC